MSRDSNVWYGPSLLTDDDLHLFNEGNHFYLHHKLGAHPHEHDGTHGVHFAVWAPNAREVSVAGDFNGWNPTSHPLARRGDSGIWEGFIPGLGHGALYKYVLTLPDGMRRHDKADPMGRWHQEPPETASIVWDTTYHWDDSEWISQRAQTNAAESPMSVYEVHIGSWMRDPENPDAFFNYRDLAFALVDHLDKTQFTHIELLPIMEHPFYGSWGYQSTGYFAPSSRYGTPQDFKFFIDYLHQRGYGVILDWVPSHFPHDAYGLANFDGTALYEHEDPRRGFHPDWKSAIFNYDRHEVRSFLISSAIHWLDEYHIDGLRVDAVASMLYLDYSRGPDEWLPNEFGGRENLGAIQMMRRLNEVVYADFPGVQTIAEESTSWPNVSRPTYIGGLGFGMKWDMGWMNDTLRYMQRDPIHRSYHHDELTFRSVYAFNENYVLSLSHDEVVHLKKSLIGKMPGDRWQQFANLRTLYAYMFGLPGKKLLFMGAELAQWREWNHDASLDWHLLDDPMHQGIMNLVGDLNRVLRGSPALYEQDFHPDGYQWINGSTSAESVISWLRWDKKRARPVAVICNFTPTVHENWRVGLPFAGEWTELFNSDAEKYAGSNVGNMGAVHAEHHPVAGQPCSASVTLPPLGVLFLTAKAPAPRKSRRRRGSRRK